MVKCVTQVDHDGGTQLDIDATGRGKNSGHFLGAVGESLAKSFVIPTLLDLHQFIVLLLKRLNVFEGKLENVSLFDGL